MKIVIIHKFTLNFVVNIDEKHVQPRLDYREKETSLIESGP